MFLYRSLFFIASVCWGVNYANRVLDADHAFFVGPYGVDMTLDCALRNFTYVRAQQLLPERAPLLSVFDALRLSIDCNQTRPDNVRLLETTRVSGPFYASPPPLAGVLRTLPLPRSDTRSWFVDATHDTDMNGCGTETTPCATIAFALSQSRATGGGGSIILRGGSSPYVLSTPLVLNSTDSGLILSAYPGEAPVVSGGALLPPLTWVSVGPSPNTTFNATVWAAVIPTGAAVVPFASLFGPDGRRSTRARWPNGNPETDGLMPNGYTKASSWLPPNTPVTSLVQQRPQLDTLPREACPSDACTSNGPSGAGPPWAIFCCFFWGVNGTAENFTTGSFWGVQPGPPGGSTVRTPGGMVAGPDLLPRLAGWASPSSPYVLHAFHSLYWGNWIFRVGSVDAASGVFTFATGGTQEARGSGAGDYLFIENVREELDEPGEWYLETNGTNNTLYYCANGTTVPPSTGWIAGQLDNLITLSGSAEEPVSDIVITGLTFAYTEPTYLQPFTAPSGGDWSFQDNGAVRFAGTRNCSITGALFINIGGSGVMLSGWNRDAAVEDSEFLWIGESAVISAGLGGSQYDNSMSNASVGEGLVLARNLVHEVGLFVKQAGFYYHAMTANVTVIENVVFNGPRAGININDGFGGGHDISRNVAFNMVRETSDHGPFNSWDRNTYKWNEGTGGTTQLLSYLDQNLFVANYHAVVPIDHDDGSNGYLDTRNVLLWGGTKNLMGYNKRSVNNSLVYVDYTPAITVSTELRERIGWSVAGIESKPPMCSGYITSFPAATGLADSWTQNNCIASTASSFFRFFACNSSDPLDGSIPVPMQNNRYFSTNASYSLQCGGEVWGLTEAQSRGVDLGSTVSELPTTDELLVMLGDTLS